MIRVASLYLPQLPIERLRQEERHRAQPDPTGARRSAPPLPAVDDDPGACSVPRGGGWRPGARWARAEDLPAHQRPTMREMGRRSEAADHPFRAMRSDEGAPGHPPRWALPVLATWAKPLVLIERIGQRDVISAACPVAQDLGIHPAMAAAHARALVPDLEVRDAQRTQDQAWLERLAFHAVRHWTPTASVAGADGLWLDLTGTTHLFGGERRFCRRLLRFLERFGFTASIAIAGTPGAAHALARYGGQSISILPAGAETDAIAELPLGALRLTPEALSTAARFGLERIADLYPMPRGPLAKRLGLQTVERLDQARGLAAEPISGVVPFEQPLVQRRLLEPIGTAEAIAQVISDLVDELVPALQSRRLGLRAGLLTCLIVDGGEQRIGIGTAKATREPRHLKRMLGLRIERIDPGLGIEAMSLAALRVEDLASEALCIPLAGESSATDIAPLVDQLGGRVGSDALFRLEARESDVPERAAVRTGPLGTPRGWPTWQRPARLLNRPELLRSVVALLPDHPPRRFEWRGTSYRVVAGDGPERILGEWWRRPGEMWAVRDYFRVEAEQGERFWVFRRGDGIETATGDLTWYMHGVFG
jgi:protein ImuB